MLHAPRMPSCGLLRMGSGQLDLNWPGNDRTRPAVLLLTWGGKAVPGTQQPHTTARRIMPFVATQQGHSSCLKRVASLLLLLLLRRRRSCKQAIDGTGFDGDSLGLAAAGAAGGIESGLAQAAPHGG